MNPSNSGDLDPGSTFEMSVLLWDDVFRWSWFCFLVRCWYKLFFCLVLIICFTYDFILCFANLYQMKQFVLYFFLGIADALVLYNYPFTFSKKKLSHIILLQWRVENKLQQYFTSGAKGDAYEENNIMDQEYFQGIDYYHT